MSGPFGSHQWMYASGGFYGFDIESSLRFNDDDSAYLTFTPASAGNRKTWTWSAWIKRSTLGTYQRPFQASSDANNRTELTFYPDNTLEFFTTIGGVHKASLKTQAVFRDPSAWFHLVVKFDAANTSLVIYINGVSQTLTTTTAVVNTDHMVNSTNVHTLGRYNPTGASYFDGYMAEVNFIDGTALTADSFGETKEGIWIPKDTSGLTFGTNGFRLQFKDDAEVQGFNTVLWEGNGGTQAVTGTGFQPDFVWIKNRDNADDHYLYDSVRGPKNFLGSNTTTAEDYSSNDLSSFDSDGFTVGSDGGLNRDGQSIVAWAWDAGANNTITGHSSVIYEGSGSTSQRITGFPFSPDLVWIKCRGAAENHNLMDTVRGWGKRLKTNNTNAEETFSGGGFYPDGFAPETTSDDQNKNATTFVAWGWDAGDSDPVSNTDGSITSTVKASTTDGFSIVSYTGTGANATVGHSLGAVPSWIIVKDRDGAQNWVVYHNAINSDGNQYLELNTTQGTQSSSVFWNSTAPTSSVFSVGTSNSVSGRNFIAYCWSEKSAYSKFGSFTGTGANLDITLGFRAGWVMIKRTDSTDNWYIFDSSRDPFGMTRSLYADVTSSEGDSSTRSVTVDSDGMIIGSNSNINASGGTFIYMAFAGSYSDYITDVNTTGSITSRVKANTTYGFSVVSYVGSGANATVGHGLDNAPEMIIARSRDSVSNWGVYHSSLTATDIIYLNLTNASGASSTQWNDTEPTSSVFSLGSGGQNKSGEDHIAYCWSEVSGYSKFGSYSGNGSTSGPTVTTNFAPALIILKRTDTTGNWILIDNTRTTDTSGNDNTLFPNLSDVEATADNRVQFTSTGFQLVTTAGNFNASGGTYIYMAFADTRDAAFWLDSSGNDNDFQHVNLDHNDTVSDSPTNNFCTMNPIAKFGTPSAFTLADGNLDLTFTSSSGNDSAVGTMGVSSGKFYYEVELVSHADDANAGFTTAEALATETNTDGAAYYKSIGFQRGDRGVVWGSEPSPTQRFNTLQNGDVVGFALDLDANKLYIHVNGSDSPVATLDVPTDKGDTFIPCCGDDGGDAGQFIFNFGQQPFKYGPPE